MKSVLVALCLALSGCTLFQPAQVPVSQKMPVAAQEAQKAINEANIALAAVANVVVQQLADGILTKPEAQSYVAKLKEAAAKVDQAQKLLDQGLVLDAKTQAELISRLIVALHKEVASRRKTL